MAPQEHSHQAGEVEGADERRVFWALLLTAGFLAVEVAGGVLSGSLALLADAGHMLTDAFSLTLALIAFRLSRRQPDQAKTFGYQRAQVLAAFVNGLVLLAVSGWIFYEAVLRLLAPVRILGGLMLGVAIAGLAVNLAAIWVLQGGNRENLNLRGALLHVLGDTLGSVAVIAAAGLIMATGWDPIDPILSFAVGGLIVFSAWKIIRQSAHILMEGAPPALDQAALRQDLARAIPAVRDVHHLHAWFLTPDRPPLVTMHLNVAPGVDLDDLHQQVQAFLRQNYGIEHATIQVENAQCSDRECVWEQD